MQFPTIFGLPAHPLIVHATVVIVPLAAVAVLLHAFWPRARARLGLVTPLAALTAVVLVPLSTSSGEQLEGTVGDSRLVQQHASLAEGLLPWTIGLLVVATLLWLRDRRDAGRRTPGVAPERGPWPTLLAPLVIGVLAVVAFLGTTQQVIRIGHSGAKAAWQNVAAHEHPGGRDRDADGDGR